MMNLTEKHWLSIYYRFCTGHCENICTLFNFRLQFLQGSTKTLCFETFLVKIYH